MDGYVCLKVNECTNLGLSKGLWTGESLKLKDCSDIVTPCIFHTLSSSREISWELCNVACVLSDSVVQVHCGAMFTCLVPFTIMCYLHLFLWNALNANGFSIKISRGEIYMIYCIAAMPRKHDEIQIFQCMAWFLKKGKNGPHQQVSFQKLHSLSSNTDCNLLKVSCLTVCFLHH